MGGTTLFPSVIRIGYLVLTLVWWWEMLVLVAASFSIGGFVKHLLTCGGFVKHSLTLPMIGI